MNIDFERLAGSGTGPGSRRTVGSEIRHFTAVTSTMDVAWDLANEGAVDGTVIVADHQSAGRGRFDRSWVSGHGQDILCSIVLRPRSSLAGELLMLAALAVVDVAESYGIDAGIKWPNDVQVKGKKLAGIIAESVSGPNRSRSDHATVIRPGNEAEANNGPDQLLAVVGIGLNLNYDFSTSDDTALGSGATSLSSELGRQLDRIAVFEKLLLSLDKHYSDLSAGGSVLPAWREKLTTLGRMVTVVSGDATGITKLHGLAHDVDSMGRLIIRDADGRDWPVSAGEVTVQDIE